MQTGHSVPPYVAVLEMMLAQWNAAAISAVAKLGIADQLVSGPKTTQELASLLNLHEDSLYRVLRALAGVGIFHEGENRTFSQTPLSDVLRTNAKQSLRYAATMMIDDWQYRGVQGICTTIENGRPAVANVLGAGLFEYLRAHPEEAFNFNRGMTDLSSGEAPAVVATYDFSGFERIVDVAGGAGGLLAEILASTQKLRGTLFDQPSVIQQAKSDALLAPFSDRCELVGGDFFEAVPAGADAYIMKHIIHDWDDERAAKILANCRRAMKPGGKLLVVDRVIGPPNAPDPKKFFDVAMMLMPGGRERSEPEWKALYAAAGFRVTRILPTPVPHSIIEGVPI
jgi:SAM-dependent methyltransferase